MSRLVAGLAALALLGAGAVALAQTPPLAAKLAACESGSAPEDRFAVFSGAMPREGAAVMEMRFDLYERVGGGAWERVALPNWGSWERTTRRDVPGFIFTKRVEQLAAPAAFRARVRFRWSDAKGRVMQTATRTSRSCRQPDWRPDLRVVDVDPAETAGQPTRVVVRNRGRGAAASFDVAVTRGSTTRIRTVTGLPAGERATVTVPVGRCGPNGTVRVSVDPANAVEEALETNNDITVACPS